ncbi:MAG: hypothetical protein GF411_09255 [Candidatus Lokiarchaeota archaeon]|nr:hypothetical protein [Candidatus Lokiarchaeota archaeon]
MDEFSVIGEMIQATTSTMGKYYIGLFDDSGEIAFQIAWGDAWGYEKKCRFSVFYYPQNGGSHSYSSDYESTTTTWEGNLWWEQWQGGEGAIYGSIDGDVMAYPWEVDNSSRIISTVAIRAQRYSSWALADMRLHDISLIADLSQHDPNDPYPCDGTNSGNEPSVTACSFVDGIFSMIEDNTHSEWTGPWPTLHMITDVTLEGGGMYICELIVDLLESISIGEFTLDTPLDDHLTATQTDELHAQGIKEFMQDAFPPEANLLLVAVLAMGIIEVYLEAMTVAPTPFQLAILYGLITVFGIAMFAALYAVVDAVLSERMTPGVAIQWLLAALLGLGIESIIEKMQYLKFYSKYWNTRNLPWGKRGLLLIGLSFYMLAVKCFIISLICSLILKMWELSISYYDIFS